MARLELKPVTQERIDARLAWLRREWMAVPQYVRDWETWDEDAKLSFVLEAGIREDYLAGARVWAEAGLMSAEQLRKFGEVERIACANRPLLEPLLAED